MLKDSNHRCIIVVLFAPQAHTTYNQLFAPLLKGDNAHIQNATQTQTQVSIPLRALSGLMTILAGN